MLLGYCIIDYCIKFSGTTPQRRDFEYPRVLSKTSPHPKIIEEFRKKYIEQEAIHKQLPSDSEDEKVRIIYIKLSVCLILEFYSWFFY